MEYQIKLQRAHEEHFALCGDRVVSIESELADGNFLRDSGDTRIVDEILEKLGLLPRVYATNRNILRVDAGEFKFSGLVMLPPDKAKQVARWDEEEADRNRYD